MLNLKSLTWKTGKEKVDLKKGKPCTVSFQRGNFNMQLSFPLLVSEKVSISEQKCKMPCKTAETLIILPESDHASLDSRKYE